MSSTSSASTIAYLKSVTLLSMETFSHLQEVRQKEERIAASKEFERLRAQIADRESAIPSLVECECVRRMADNDKHVRECERTVEMLSEEVREREETTNTCLGAKKRNGKRLKY